jgi:uncharacterized protein with ParB-like and HNH nuclease domain
MTCEYEKPISIEEAIQSINRHHFLLPALQRKFVWSSQQICVLFDSIMRDYPINTFMMWEVTKPEIKNNFKFYEFIKDYCQRLNDENPHIPTNASFDDFKAVIDGQQRLTSMYLGLCSTYAYKQPRVWWPSVRDNKLLPPRKLYLDLMQELTSEDDESLMKFNFKFLTDEQYKNSTKLDNNPHHWYCLHNVLELEKVDGGSNIWHKIVRPYLEIHNLVGNNFAETTLSKLYEVIRIKKIINYFNETSQEIDDVLDVFIRTNSGGTKLEFSDLLMSIAVANWDGDFRNELDELIKQIHQSPDMGFYLGRDWVLKTCLMLTGADVRFKVKNFKIEQVEAIQKDWQQIKECIKETFKLIKRLGINAQSLTSKNAVIPICYYLYKKIINKTPLYTTINNLANHKEQRDKISQWFYMVLLKGVFGGQADTILSSMKVVLDKHIGNDYFPLDEIVQTYVATRKDLRFDDAYIESLLSTQYGEGRCRALLHLLYPEMNATEVFHIDHLHPKVAFERKSLKEIDFLKSDENLMSFYSDNKNWNSIPNLHLLNDSQNLHKKDKPLMTWVSDEKINIPSLKNVSLEFSAFREFYEKRRTELREKLIKRVYMTNDVLLPEDNLEDDGEILEELAE